MMGTIVGAPVSAELPGDARTYRELACAVRDAGLMRHRAGSELARMALTAVVFAAGWVAVLLFHGMWASLVTAVYLGVASAQLTFIGHDAGHRQIFGSRKANRVVGLVVGNLLAGLSFGWWVPKHAAHHGYPNQIGRDPDVAPGVVAFTAQAAAQGGPSRRLFLRWQGVLLFPLMCLQIVSMRVASSRSIRDRRNESRVVEAALIAAHAVGYLALVFLALPPLQAVAFIAVHHAVFGLYLGCSFAPNHVGMPTLDEGAVTSFAYRQVVTSRNIRGGRIVSFLLGGLDLQIEHHLFPAMPRCNLRKAQPLVRAFCAEQGWPYREERLLASYASVLHHVWRIGRRLPLGGVGVLAVD